MALTGSPADQPPDNAPRALRITVAYDGDRLQVVSRQEVDMRPLPSDPVHDYRGRSGSWFEVHDSSGRVIYRRTLHDVMPTDMEAPSGDPQRPFTRVDVPERRGTFVLTIPNVSHARSIVLFGSPRDDRRKAARETGRLDVRGPESKRRDASEAP